MMKKTYLPVRSCFDLTGHMQPVSLTWRNRDYPIEAVRDYQPAKSQIRNWGNSDCYIVVINGNEKHLFFERCEPALPDRLGRWYVESAG